MPRGVKPKVDYDAEIAQIDEMINIYRMNLRQLSVQRQSLLSKKQHADMDVVLEHIIQSGLTADEVLELVNSTISKKPHKK